MNSASNEYSCRSELDHVDHLRDEIGRYAAIDLLELALGLEGETRPEREHIALVVREHAVEIAGRVDEVDRLEIAVAKAQSSGQREGHRIDARHLRCARDMILESLRSPTTHTSSPGRSSRVTNVAARTGVSPISCGS